MTDKIYSLEEIKLIVLPIAERHRIEHLYLFGSYARGEATSESDLDFRIDRGEVRDLFQLGGLHSDLEDAFGKDVDLLTTGSLDERFLNRIARDEVLLYSRGQGKS